MNGLNPEALEALRRVGYAGRVGVDSLGPESSSSSFSARGRGK
jgi:hypothetical protein